MQLKHHNSPDGLTDQKARVGLKVVLNILAKWQCSEIEKMAILGVSRSTLHKHTRNPLSARVGQDLRERISYVLNIHESLRKAYENPENVYGFLRMPNHNEFFNGESPMDILSQGLVANLYEVHRRMDVLMEG